MNRYNCAHGLENSILLDTNSPQIDQYMQRNPNPSQNPSIKIFGRVIF